MPSERTRYRNVRFYNASTGEFLGGFFQKGSLIENSLLVILSRVLLLVDGGFDISVTQLATDSPNPFAPGDYDLYSQGMNDIYMDLHRKYAHCALGSIKLIDENWFARLITYSMSSREDAFRDSVRERDRKCVVSGEVVHAADFDI